MPCFNENPPWRQLQNAAIVYPAGSVITQIRRLCFADSFIWQDNLETTPKAVLFHLRSSICPNIFVSKSEDIKQSMAACRL